MTFDTNNIAKLALLARLALSEKEMERLGSELERILEMVKELQKVDVTGLKPMSHADDRGLPLREDVAYTPNGRKNLEQSQGYEDGLVRVPKIIE
ncbi:MAG TPA: Asp-tRNA(Asn)/Glu-tRNA(Gln) amidotransferase subunit GatC [Myxococcota bacterium]|nr:Asp-tRNA(Asn)/Glu-tRNA(Gln) amidotransferase subunit GatC [Myxococcota bacterium]